MNTHAPAHKRRHNETALQSECEACSSGQSVPTQLSIGASDATNQREQNDLADVVRLCNLGTAASQQQARDLARAMFGRHRSRYWTAQRGSAALRAAFESAGMRYTGGNTTASVYNLPDGTVVRMTIEHSRRLADDPTRAVDANNLQFVLDDENSVLLEFLRALDPFQ